MTACIGEPISWLRLEQHALAADTAVAAHLDACAACRACMDEIRRDVVALPALVVPARRARKWWLFALPALAAAALAIVVLRPRPREDVVAIKGVGEVVLGTVRERAGAIREDVHTFRPGDRWKVVVTCPPAAHVQIDVYVGTDHPLAPAELACGNRIVVPGAFTLTGTRPNRVCAHVSSDEGAGEACVTVSPE